MRATVQKNCPRTPPRLSFARDPCRGFPDNGGWRVHALLGAETRALVHYTALSVFKLVMHRFFLFRKPIGF